MCYEKETNMRDQLYSAAYRYKKTGLWRKLWDSDVFAVALSDGQIAYISVMGKAGTFCALGVYIGEDGFQSYRLVAGDAGGAEGVSGYDQFESYLQQNCLQMVLGNKDELKPEEVEEVRAYAKANGIRLSGKNAFVQFVKYEPNYHPWDVRSEEDQQHLREALEAAILLSAEIDKSNARNLGLVEIGPDTADVPLFGIKDNVLHSLGRTPLPAYKEPSYPFAEMNNDVLLAAMKKLKRVGIWEAELVRMRNPVQEKSNEVPYYPLLLLLIEKKSSYMLPAPILVGADDRPQDILQEFANAWRSQEYLAEEILCSDQRTYALLKDFCEKAKVKVSLAGARMKELEDAKNLLFNRSADANRFDEELYDEMDDDYEDGSGFEMDEETARQMFEEMIESILSMNARELRELPQEVYEYLKMMVEQGVLPADIERKLRRKLKF